jgi:hypothetical protein
MRKRGYSRRHLIRARGMLLQVESLVCGVRRQLFDVFQDAVEFVEVVVADDQFS